MGKLRPKGLSEEWRREIAAARERRGWSQKELGRRAGLPQAHISGIETGKVSPRLDTLLELVRVLGYDLLLVERSLVPAARALMRDYGKPGEEAGERSLYAEEGELEGEPEGEGERDDS